jgi:hypothetical protein
MRHILHKESHNEKEQCRRNIIHIAVRGNKPGGGAGRGGGEGSIWGALSIGARSSMGGGRWVNNIVKERKMR